MTSGAPSPGRGLGEPAAIDGVRAERDAAAARCRELEAELGRLRGRVRSLERAMWRRTAQRRLVGDHIARLGRTLPWRRRRNRRDGV